MHLSSFWGALQLLVARSYSRKKIASSCGGGVGGSSTAHEDDAGSKSIRLNAPTAGLPLCSHGPSSSNSKAGLNNGLKTQLSGYKSNRLNWLEKGGSGSCGFCSLNA